MTGEPITNGEGLDFLVNFISGIRPGRAGINATANLSQVTLLLAEKPELLNRLRNVVHGQLVRTDLSAALMESGIAAAKAKNFAIIILVGDEPYYAKVGFSRLPPGRLHFPGPVDPGRLLGLSLQAGALLDLTGDVRRA